MKIVLFGSDTEKNAGIRYRLLYFARRLEAEGHQCVVCLHASIALKERLYESRGRWFKLLYLAIVLLRRFAQIRHVAGADVVFFRGPLFPYGPPVLERVIRWLNPRLIFDIDDAVWEPAAHVRSPFLRLVDYGWVRKMSALCAHAVVGNETLAAYVRQFTPHVTIVPTCIDIQAHQPKDYRAPSGPVILGWTGLSDNLGYMDLIAPVLQELAARYDVALLVASGAEYHLEGVRVENRRWTLEHEFDYLREPDIGLMPLADTPRARGKCAFKALQYMGVGTPAVISPVGMNAEVITDGVDGFLAATPEEWREKLERLIADPELRRNMGRAARETVRKRYSFEANYPQWRQAIETVAGLHDS